MDNYDKVLNACVLQARGGKLSINVFDLMYETSLPYPQLKEIADGLVSKGELAAVDLKTYKFTGDVNRPLAEPEEPADLREDDGYGENDPLAARLAFLERRREKLIERMKTARLDDDLYRRDDDGEVDYEEMERRLQSRLNEFENAPEEDGVEEADEEEENDGEEDGEYCYRGAQTVEAIVLLTEILRKARTTKPWDEIPEIRQWSSQNDFMAYCCDRIAAIFGGGETTDRQEALIKASVLLGEAQTAQCKMTEEIYSFILFALQNISDSQYQEILSLLA